MNKLIALSLIISFLNTSLCFSQLQNDSFIIKNSKIVNTLVNGLPQQLIYQGDIEISNDSKDTYIHFLDQKIKINLDFSELILKNITLESKDLEVHLFNQALVAIQARPYIYLKKIFQTWHQSTINFTPDARFDHEIKLSEMLIHNTRLMKNDRFLSFEKILIQLTLRHFSNKNLQQTADRLTALANLKVDTTLQPMKKQFGFVHSNDSPKDIKRLSTIGFMQPSVYQTAKPQSFIGFIRPINQCRLLFDK